MLAKVKELSYVRTCLFDLRVETVEVQLFEVLLNRGAYVHDYLGLIINVEVIENISMFIIGFNVF